MLMLKGLKGRYRELVRKDEEVRRNGDNMAAAVASAPLGQFNESVLIKGVG
jgi:hypothetical protein